MKTAYFPINPVPYQNSDGTIQYDVYFGLTKREYFAAMAMQGLITGSGFKYNPSDTANYAVDFADALLSELEKTDKP